MKNKYHTVGTVPTFNRKILEIKGKKIPQCRNSSKIQEKQNDRRKQTRYLHHMYISAYIEKWRGLSLFYGLKLAILVK
jgi:hypothetical protein